MYYIFEKHSANKSQISKANLRFYFMNTICTQPEVHISTIEYLLFSFFGTDTETRGWWESKSDAVTKFYTFPLKRCFFKWKDVRKTRLASLVAF